MAKQKIKVKGTEIVVFSKEKEDYISLTDIAKYKDSGRTNYIIQNWMRSRSTIRILKASNSMPLKMKQAQIVLSDANFI